MNRFFLAATLVLSGLCFSQDSNNRFHREDTSKTMNAYYDSLQKGDSQRSAESSLAVYAELQKQRNAEERKKAIIYIVLGALFLIVLIVGLMRRKKIR